MAKFKIDKKDKELLELLRLNSRSSFTDLGVKLRLSSSTVERKLSRLMKQGVVTLLFASVNFTKLGLKHYQIYFKFDTFDENTELEVSKFFESYKRTNWSAICEGEFDAIWAIFAYDEFEVDSALGLFMEKFGSNIRDKVVAATLWDTALTWRKNQNRKQQWQKDVNVRQNLDEIDMKLLAALYWNSRASTVELAKLTNITPVAVARRIKNLVANEYILNFTTWYPMYESPEYYMIFINFRNITREKEAMFIEFCRQSDEIFFLSKFISGWDMDISIRVDNITELHKFMSRMKANFGSIIGNYHFVTVLKDVTHKALLEYTE